jgi:hypothetical protein
MALPRNTIMETRANLGADVVDRVQRIALRRKGRRGLWQTAEKATQVVLFVAVIISLISSARSRSMLRASIA